MARHEQTHSQSRKIALCGMMTALSVVILSLGSLIPLATFACPLLAMICLLPVVCDYGASAAAAVYAAAAVLGLLLCPDKEIALFYVFLGWYPGIRARLDKLPRLIRGAVKCGLFTLSVAVMYALILYLLRLEAVVEEFSDYSTAMVMILLVLGNVMFLIFDRVLALLSLMYEKKRKK